MKLNNKAFTVVELIASFALTMVITVLLFEIVQKCDYGKNSHHI